MLFHHLSLKIPNKPVLNTLASCTIISVSLCVIFPISWVCQPAFIIMDIIKCFVIFVWKLIMMGILYPACSSLLNDFIIASAWSSEIHSSKLNLCIRIWALGSIICSISTWSNGWLIVYSTIFGCHTQAQFLFLFKNHGFLSKQKGSKNLVGAILVPVHWVVPLAWPQGSDRKLDSNFHVMPLGEFLSEWLQTSLHTLLTQLCVYCLASIPFVKPSPVFQTIKVALYCVTRHIICVWLCLLN